ncbi:MAG: hypothetical protein ACE5HH_04770 [Candidatus Hydrothermarchaeales archaeon]
MEKTVLDPLALGYSAAVLGGLIMLVLSIVGLLGFGGEAVRIMQAYHIWYSLSVVGIVLGIIEGAIGSFVGGYLIAYFYNRSA